MPAIHHVALRTPDVARLEAFYAGVLELPVVRRDEARGSVWLAADGAHRALLMLERASQDEPPVPAGSRELLAFAVDAREGPRAWRVRLALAGVAVEDETEFTLYFRDPDGRRVAVSTYPLDGLVEGRT